MRTDFKFCSLLAPDLFVAASSSVSTQSNPDDLRKAAQNPVASLISVPIQENWNFGIEPYDRTHNVMNIQPVIPFSTSGRHWNLITRWITPSCFSQIPPQVIRAITVWAT